MTGPHGNVSSPAPLRDGTRPICGSSAVVGGAGTGDGGRGTKRGGEKKRKEPASHDSSEKWPCHKCDKTFTSKPAFNGHQRIHSEKQEQQAKCGNKDKKAVSRLGGTQLKSDMGVNNNQPQQQVQQPSETKGDGRAMAEGGPSSSEEAEKAKKRKEIHKNLDLNKAPVGRWEW